MSHAERIATELAAVAETMPPGSMEALADAILSAKHVFIAGAGRSGLMMRAMAMRLMHLGLKVCVVGEVVTPGIMPGDLLLVGDLLIAVDLDADRISLSIVEPG